MVSNLGWMGSLRKFQPVSCSLTGRQISTILASRILSPVNPFQIFGDSTEVKHMQPLGGEVTNARMEAVTAMLMSGSIGCSKF